MMPMSGPDTTADAPFTAAWAATDPLRPADTSPAAWAVLLARYRAMTPQERLAQTSRLNRVARELAERGVRIRYPRAEDREVQMRTLALWLDRETMRRAFCWDAGAATQP